MRGKKKAKTTAVAAAAAVHEAEYSVDEIATLLNADKGKVPQVANETPVVAELPAKKTTKGRGGKKNAVEVVTNNEPDVELPAAAVPKARGKKAATEIEVAQENGNSAVGRSTRKRAVVFYGNEIETAPKRVRVKKVPVTADDVAETNGENVKTNNRRGKKTVEKNDEVDVEVEVAVKATKGRFGKKLEIAKEIENVEPVAVPAKKRNGRAGTATAKVEKSKEEEEKEISENSSEEKKVTKKATTTKRNNKKNEVKEEQVIAEPQAAALQHEEEEEEEEEEEVVTIKSKRAKKAVTAKQPKGNNHKIATHITADEEPAAPELVENKSRKRAATNKIKSNDEEEEAAAAGN